jgi:drug/metabolite transporter (DMT)-like permease
MATVLALIAAFCFALAATLQQRGALNLTEVSLRRPSSFVRLAKQPAWLLGTAVLLAGYAIQAAALDRGRLVVIQPLLVTTVVFALPLGYFLTAQHVGRREVLGAVALVAGLGLFVIFGDPAGGRNDAPTSEWLVAIAVIALVCCALFFFGRGGSLSVKAGVYGTVAGVLFGLSASLTKPTVEALHEGIDVVLSDWTLYVLAVAGGLGFVLQQISLATGRLAPSVATVSVANPVVSIVLGVVLLEERLSRPAWHVVVALIGLGVALFAAVSIALTHEVEEGEPDPAAAAGSFV